MAPPRKHASDVILDAARTLVLSEGPRAASVAAISAASGAPAGTLYHRFGNRNGILAAAWLRSLERFHSRALAAVDVEDPVEAGATMAKAVVLFAREVPEDAQLLNFRPAHLLDGEPEESFTTQRAHMNEPVFAQMFRVTEGLFGDREAQHVDIVLRAIIDLPYSAVRRYGMYVPDWLVDAVAEDARILLRAPRG
ncbi:TetR/AcrR family transcriptional regulator [Antrihabitans sp. YC2-6]|uniref:TetR/AcrR family transcriptional regulator n=1 Tax=Antrihabitans sp. YC2-6 TaxID=2799498 RepID=UPI0018F724D2|nr:TetR family transcriptional regulator [Antrihabitans sp. YC2-6]MBJ8346202.1 TetR family transcriptional regulator [Antrihabitans sp. YC2-6]